MNVIPVPQDIRPELELCEIEVFHFIFFFFFEKIIASFLKKTNAQNINNL